jgi:hypothetical protein
MWRPGLPAIAAGVAVTHSSLHDTSLGYAAFVGGLSAMCASSLAFAVGDFAVDLRLVSALPCCVAMAFGLKAVDLCPRSIKRYPRPRERRLACR